MCFAAIASRITRAKRGTVLKDKPILRFSVLIFELGANAKFDGGADHSPMWCFR
jgi:hypothetical protein